MGIQRDFQALTWHIWFDFVPVNLLPFILLKGNKSFFICTGEKIYSLRLHTELGQFYSFASMQCTKSYNYSGWEGPLEII